MCRALPDEPRRCPCDTSAARAGRRRAAKLREGYTSKIAKKGTPSKPVKVTKTEVQPEMTPDERKAKIVDEFRELHTLATSGDEGYWKDPDHMIQMGAKVDELATEFGAPDEKAFIEHTTRLEDQQAELKAKLRTHWTERSEMEAEFMRKARDTGFVDETTWGATAAYNKLEDQDPKNPLLKQYREEREEMLQRHKSESDLHSDIRDKVDAEQKEFFTKRNEANLEALKAVGVELADPSTIVVDAKAKKDATDGLKSALRFFPQSWVDSSNSRAESEDKPLLPKVSARRAHYYEKTETNRTYSSHSKAFITRKAVDWEPDPHSQRDLEFSPVDGEEWTDPHNPNFVHSISLGSAEKAWVHQSYSYSSEPRRGYKPIVVHDEEWVRGEGYVRNGLRTIYRKPRTERSQKSVSFRNVGELTMNPQQVAVDHGNKYTTVAMHEFSHRIERSNPTIAMAEYRFLQKRAGLNTENPEPLTHIEHHGKDEKGYKDSFPHHYMGKVYNGKSYELLSMGMETLFSGTQGGFVGISEYKADPEYKNFILGLLATSAKK